MLISLLLFLAQPLCSRSFLFPSACNCGCPMAPPCPPPPVCPPVQPCLPPPPPPTCCNTCATKCRDKRSTVEDTDGMISAEIPPAAEISVQLLSREKKDHLDNNELNEIPEETDFSPQCNSEDLREIIIQNIDRITAVAKKRIQAAAETLLQARFNVICSRGDFSYVTNTELYCQHTVGDVTCYVFKQLSEVV